MKWFNKKICDVNWFSWWPIRNVNEGEDDSDDQEVILTTPSKKQMTPQKIQNPLQTEVQPKITVKNFSSLMNSKDDNEMSQIYFDTTVAMKSLDKSNNRPETPDNRPVTPYIVRSSTPFERPLTPAMRRVMSESLPISRSGTPFTIGMNNRTQCQSLTAKGLQCRNAAVQGLTKCRVHNY